MMDELVKEILIAWQKADEQAHENPSLLLQNHELFTGLCEARMEVCIITEKLLYNLPIDNINYPEELTRHLKANADQGCFACRCSSFTEDNHPECNDKMKEWFNSKEQLLVCRTNITVIWQITRRYSPVKH